MSLRRTFLTHVPPSDRRTQLANASYVACLDSYVACLVVHSTLQLQVMVEAYAEHVYRRDNLYTGVRTVRCCV